MTAADRAGRKKDLQGLLVERARNLDAAVPAAELLVTSDGGAKRIETHSREEMRLGAGHFAGRRLVGPLPGAAVGAQEGVCFVRFEKLTPGEQAAERNRGHRL